MSHRSRLGVIAIDCQADGLVEAMRFWSGALGRAFHPDPEHPGFAGGDTPEDEPFVVLHRVDHESRAHLDIETDDMAAEQARLTGLGAWLVERHAKGFVVLEAPTGQRFCLVGPQRPDFDTAAQEWGA